MCVCVCPRHSPRSLGLLRFQAWKQENSDEAQRFNLGLPLPHDDPPEGAEEAEAGGLPVAFAWVMINGERVQAAWPPAASSR